jgi:pyruvate-formate lyase-activating enzyme
VHLAELLELRAVPAAGVYLSLTRKCPLSCAHCSTDSSLSRREELPEEHLVRFVSTFKIRQSPKVMLLTGGEPLLRPALVHRLSVCAKAVGTKTALISGMFFAASSQVSPSISQAIQQIDHFTASIDTFHEKQIPRNKVFSALEYIRSIGVDVSIQTVGLNAEDPYLRDLVEEIRDRFDDGVPVFVSTVGYEGRAKTWLERPLVQNSEDHSAMPCRVATWPVVTFDGAIVACCNQEVVDGPAPAHLLVGDIRNGDTWARVREHVFGSPLLRGIRTFGPQFLATNFGNASCSGFCDTCMNLEHKAELLSKRLDEAFAKETTQFIERSVVELQKQRPHYGTPEYRSYQYLGYSSKEQDAHG